MRRLAALCLVTGLAAWPARVTDYLSVGRVGRAAIAGAG